MRVLIISQAIAQWYIDVLTNALSVDAEIDIITGSDVVGGNIIKSPKHDPKSFSSRFLCWIKHIFFMKKWMKENKSNNYDLIFAVSNPPINPYIGLKLKKKFGAPFIYMNWDIYPDVIDATIKNPFVTFACKLWNAWNNKNYIKIDKILTIGSRVADSINSSLKNKVNISVIPIGVDCNKLCHVNKSDNEFLKQHGLAGKFIVLYSGKMGYGHNLEVVIEAAKKLESYKDILFLFIGEGQKYKMVESLSEGCENIMVFPFQSEDIFPQSMASGDIGIVAQENKMAHLFMPSKTYSMMACGMPVIGICSGNDDLSALINDKKIGFTVTDESADKLAEYILRLYNDKTELELLKTKARNCAEKDFDISVVTESYREIFESVIKKDR